MISTLNPTNERVPFTTAVEHPAYNSGELIIVECYSTKENAKEGHEKWLDLMINENLPDPLEDYSSTVYARTTILGKKLFRRDMKLIKFKDNIRNPNTRPSNIATFIRRSLEEKVGEDWNGVMQLQEIIGRLVNMLAQKDLMSPEEVYLLAKGYVGEETAEFVEEN